jgi:4-alpha-glucanotransferase
VLPLVPPDPEYYSPYSGLDTNCGNPLLIDLAALITEGLLDPSDTPPVMPDGDVQFEKVGQPAATVCGRAQHDSSNMCARLLQQRC